jgi:hypothetical protein
MNLSVILPALAVVTLAQFSIMTGVFFISGQLLPQTLAAVYAKFPDSVTRMIIASILIMPAANWAVGYAYGHFPPGIVAPLVVVAMVLMNISFTMVHLGTRLSPALAAAIALMMASSAWAAWLLQAK